MLETRYTTLDEILASATQPMPAKLQDHHLGSILSSFAAIRAGATPGMADVQAMGDCVNLLDSLSRIEFRDADGEVGSLSLPGDLLPRGVQAVAGLAMRVKAGKPVRFTGEEQGIMLELIDTYREVVATVPHRAMVRAWRQTMKDAQNARRGKLRGENVTVVEV